mmetsp:Transcript_34619/g.62774  ORF Transcript_34619/g.62774 Transcript_34619/m.62774 type:complete len:119 (+) Transcript_34619:42-398(+)
MPGEKAPRAKRRKLEPLLEECGLGKEANLSQTLAGQEGSGSRSSGRALTAEQCKSLCLKLLERVELQKETSKLWSERDELVELLRRKRAEVEMLEAKLRARQLLEDVRQRLGQLLEKS